MHTELTVGNTYLGLLEFIQTWSHTHHCWFRFHYLTVEGHTFLMRQSRRRMAV